MNVKIASLLAIVLVLIGGAILLLHILEKEQPANEFTCISELMGAHEYYENKIVKVKGSITMIYGHFEVEDNTGKILISYFGKGLPYNIGENVVVTVGLSYTPISSIWPGFDMINIENAGENQTPGVVEIDEVLENLENRLGSMEMFEITATIRGTISAIGTNCRVSDNTGEIYCYSSESFPYTVGENVAVEGKFIIYRDPAGYYNLYGHYLRIHMQRVERAR